MDAKTAAAAIDFMSELATDLDALQKKLEKTERKWFCKLLKTQRKCIQQRALRERSDSRVHELEEEISSLQARFNKLQRRAKQFKNSLRFMVGQNDCLGSELKMIREHMKNRKRVRKESPSKSSESDSDCEVRILTDSEPEGVERQLPEPLRSLEVTSSLEPANADLLVPPSRGRDAGSPETIDLMRKGAKGLEALQKKLAEMERKFNRECVWCEHSDIRVHELQEENASLQARLNISQRQAEVLNHDFRFMMRHSDFLESELVKLKNHLKNHKRMREESPSKSGESDGEVRVLTEKERAEEETLLQKPIQVITSSLEAGNADSLLPPRRGRNAGSRAPRLIE
ncbi:hypothetical protein R1sor_007842 [Riccia sorocarpa]|uniref:Uncharacterized protein n=1 Tax=Riccia sorocarpa TaxID=122646 RepID=A0ABD3HTT7_9MARC